MKIVTFLLLLLPLSAHSVDWQNPVHTGDCYAWDVERDVVRLVAYTMNIPQEAVKRTFVHCDPWTAISGSSTTFRLLGDEAVGCTDTRYWTWYIGCTWANASGYSPPGWIAVLRMHPNVSHFMIDAALRKGMSLGSRSREEIVCLLGSLNRFARLVIHEYLHVWFGYVEHDQAMADAEAYWYNQFRARYGEYWVDAREWNCQQPRIFNYEPITEEILP